MFTFRVPHMLEMYCLTTLNVRLRLFLPQRTSCSSAKQFCTKTLRFRAPYIGLLFGWILPPLCKHINLNSSQHTALSQTIMLPLTQCNRYKQIRLYLDRWHSSGRGENTSWNLHSGDTKQSSTEKFQNAMQSSACYISDIRKKSVALCAGSSLPCLLFNL
jgi:hypothetical protein